MKEIDILTEDWDLYILLDGCRYDVFSKLYKKYLGDEGMLKEVKGFAKSSDWMFDNFNGRDECNGSIYVNHTIMYDKFLPDSRFFKVINVWEKHWDYTYGTVLPESITEVAKQHMTKHKDKRFIVHYITPHPPFLEHKFLGLDLIDTPEKVIAGLDKGKKTNFDIMHMTQGSLRNIFGGRIAWDLLLTFGFPPSDYFGRIYTIYGYDSIVEGYRANLHRALKNVVELLDGFKGNVLISADHSTFYTGGARNLEQESIPYFTMEEYNGKR